MLAFKPLIAEVRQSDILADRSQAALLLYELSPFLMIPGLDDVAHLIDKHIIVRLVAEFDMHRLLTLSELKT